MSWVRLDDRFPGHPKIRRVGPLGMALHVAALCHCSEYLTDGIIDRSVLAALIDLSEFVGVRKLAITPQVLADRLVLAGLWERSEDGEQYAVHDYLAYNPSRDTVLREREAAKVRMDRRRGSPDVRPNKTRTNADVRPKFNDPVPDPLPHSSSTTASTPRAPVLQEILAGGIPKDAPIPEHPLGAVLDDYLTEEMVEWAKTQLQPQLSVVEINAATQEFERYWQQRPGQVRTLQGWRDGWTKAILHAVTAKSRGLAMAS